MIDDDSNNKRVICQKIIFKNNKNFNFEILEKFLFSIQ